MYRKEICYDRESRNYAMYLDGELVGFARTYHEAGITLDQLVFELMSGQFFRETTEIVDTTERKPDPLPGVCKNCYQPHPTYRCPEIWSYLRAGPEADVYLSCGDDLGRPGPGICGACVETGERLAA